MGVRYENTDNRESQTEFLPPAGDFVRHAPEEGAIHMPIDGDSPYRATVVARERGKGGTVIVRKRETVYRGMKPEPYHIKPEFHRLKAGEEIVLVGKHKFTGT